MASNKTPNDQDPEQNAPSNKSTIQIKELLQLGWFSTDRLLLENEASHYDFHEVNSSSTGEAEQSTSAADGSIRVENSVRVAMLLVRSFAVYFGLYGENRGNDGSHGSLDSICFEDFFVTLEEFENDDVVTSGNSEMSETRRNATQNKNQQQIHDEVEIVKEIKSPKSAEKGTRAPTQDSLKVGFFSSFDDKGSNSYQELFTKSVTEVDRLQEDRKIAARKRAAARALAQSKDVDGLELGMGYFSEMNQYATEVQDSQQKCLQQEDPKPDDDKIYDTFPTLEYTPKRSKHRSLIEIEIISPLALDEMDQINQNRFLNETKAIQRLGCLIYSVFSGGKDPPPQYSSPSLSAVSSYADTNKYHIEKEGRKLKSSRREDTTILSDLLECNCYPISICHFLSDMIDTGPEGNATNPFTTMEEILQDLEEMISHPYLFLHDSHSGVGIPILPAFGRQYHGRKKEVARFLEIPTRMEVSNRSVSSKSQFGNNSGKVEAIFVSGRGGSGKSHLVNKCGDFLSMQGWLVIGKKFERGLEHNAQGVVCSLFDEVVKILVMMRSGGDEQDTEYSENVAKILVDSFDASSLSSLFGYLPSIKSFLDGIAVKRTSFVESNLMHWQLVFLLTRFINALLRANRPIMLILDDLQWSDELTIELVLGDILEAVFDGKGGCNFLFAGVYRDDNMSNEHPLSAKLSNLRQSQSVHVTDIDLSSFTKRDISEIIANELRLPSRVVSELGDIVHKKTSGHIFYAVELLNALVRDSTIYFSLKTRRFQWCWEKICSLKTSDSVAQFMVSTFSTLEPEVLQMLRLLSCFGLHTDVDVLDILDASCVAPFDGIRTPLQNLSDLGFIEVAGGLVRFTHDLIQQHVYESIELEQRRTFHIEIGLFLGWKVSTSRTSSDASSLEGAVGKMYISESKSQGSVITERSLLSIATDHINHAGPEFVEQSERKSFAIWNLEVGKELSARCDFGCALHYYEQGIAFVGNEVWVDECDINGKYFCLDLYEGAAEAASAIRNDTKVKHYTNVIIRNVPLDNSLPAWITLISSLESNGRHLEILEKGIKLIQLLNIDIPPPPPSPTAVMESMATTTIAASQYDINLILSTNQSKTDRHQRNVLRLFDAITVAAYSVSSPYLPLLTFAMVRYSLKNHIHETESAFAFAGFGYFHIVFKQDYVRGKYWADVALRILKQKRAISATVRVEWLVHGHILMWFSPLKETSRKLFETYHLSMQVGDFRTAMFSLNLSTRFAVFEGENLQILSRSIGSNLKNMLKHNSECAKLAVLDAVMVDEIRGEDSTPFAVFDGLFLNDDDLMKDALVKKNMNLLSNIYLRRFFSSFWAGDHSSAESCSENILSIPSAKRPKLLSIYFTFFRGLIAFQQYRKNQSDDDLQKGICAINTIEVWLKYSPSNFENKLILLYAEQQASLPNIQAARNLYDASIKSARDNGRVHEQGLACELMGKFLMSVANDFICAKEYLKKAQLCYLQWGARKKASMLSKDYGIKADDVYPVSNPLKHGRDS